MNPQNQKQPCEPGRVARFADRWNKPAIGSNRNLGLGMRMSNGMSLAALVLGTAGSALATDLPVNVTVDPAPNLPVNVPVDPAPNPAENIKVSMMPSHHQNEHYAKAVVGQPIQVWGKVSGGGYAGYTIDFGDGSAPATGDSVPKPEFINSLHSYTHSGTFVASLSVTNTDGKVFDRKVNIKVVATPSEQDKIDIAVEKGLLNLYGNASGLPDSCTFSETQTSERYKIAATAAAVLAFEENGHLPTNDPVADIYQNLVNQGLLYLKGQAQDWEYYKTRSFVLSTLALIQAMPRDPNAADFSQRWNGPDGQFIKSRIQEVTTAYRPNRFRYKGWTDDLSDPSDSPATSEASQWVSYLLWKYDDIPTLSPSQSGDNIFSTWSSFFQSQEYYSVDVLNGFIMYYNELAKREGHTSSEGAYFVDGWIHARSLENIPDSKPGWFGRINNMFILGKVSHLLPGFPDDLYYQDWQRLLSSWLLGKNDLTLFEPAADGQVSFGLVHRVPGMLYGQNADGSWSGLPLPSPDDVVSSPVATTALAVATLIREDVTPSNDQLNAEYSSNFVNVSGGNNSLPEIKPDLMLGDEGLVSFNVDDADRDILGVVLNIDGREDAPKVIAGGGEVSFMRTGIAKLYGTNTVRVFANDGWGTSFRTWIVKRPDTFPPYFSPETIKQFVDLKINTAPGLATASFIPPGATAYDTAADGSQTPVPVQSNPPGVATLGIGVHQVTYTAFDPATNTATISFLVRVIDNESPTVSQPKDLLTLAADGKPVQLVVPDAKDNSGQVSWEYRSGADLLWSSSGAGREFQNPPLGTNRYTLMVADGSGNTVSRFFNAIVIDNIPPSLVKPDDIVVNTKPGSNGADVSLPTPIVTDNSGSVTWAYTWGADSYTSTDVRTTTKSFPIGITPVYLTAFDPSGNQSSCIVNLMVLDKEAPVISPIASFTVRCDFGVAFATIGNALKPSVVARDNSGVPPTIVQNYPAENKLKIGQNKIEVTATDGSGNVSIYPYIVTVIDDQTPYFLGDVMPVTFVTPPGQASVKVSPNLPLAKDNSGVFTKKLVVNGKDYPFTGDSWAIDYPIGITSVKYVVSDPSGNTASKSFTVTVLDKEAPQFAVMPSVEASGSPTITLTNPDLLSRLVANGLKVTDNDGKIPSLTINRMSPSTFSRGTTSITIWATDSSGNRATNSFSLTVK